MSLKTKDRLTSAFLAAALLAGGLLLVPGVGSALNAEGGLSQDIQGRSCTPVWMLYNPNSSEHLFSTSRNERKTLSRLGWKDEGICFGSSSENGVPVYRFYLKAAGEHLYTTVRSEMEQLEKDGWRNEGVAFYAAGQSANPLTRLLNPNAKGAAHHYTSDQKEVDALVSLGWIKEGTAFQVYDAYYLQKEVHDGKEVTRCYDSNGDLYTGVLRLRGGTYYFDPSFGGDMAIGWRTLNVDDLDLYYESAVVVTPPRRYAQDLENEKRSELEKSQVTSDQASADRKKTASETKEHIDSEEKAGSEELLIEYSSAKDGEIMISESGYSQELLEEGDVLVMPADGVLEVPVFDPPKWETGIISESAGTQIEVYFKENGRMAKGETELEDGIHYFGPENGAHVRNAFVRYGKPAKTCYFDENGRRVSGEKMIDGRVYTFDEKTGALKRNLNELLDQAVAIIKANALPGEDFSLCVRLPDDNQMLSWNEHSQQSASVMKLFVMAAIYDNYEQYARVWGKNMLDANLSVMIQYSDNDAWRDLVMVLGDGDFYKGCKQLSAWNAKKGYGNTRMEGVDYGNFTSVEDCSKILEDIYQGKLTHSKEMLALIQSQAIPGRLLNGIPAGTRTGNKPGWLYNTENDTVLVYTPKGVYTLSLLSTNLQSPARAQVIMQQVSALTWQWMQKNL